MDVRETPLSGIEAIAEVNEMSAEFPFCFWAAEYGLPTVTVTQPLVQREDTGKFLHVFNPWKRRLGQVVEDLASEMKGEPNACP